MYISQRIINVVVLNNNKINEYIISSCRELGFSDNELIDSR